MMTKHIENNFDVLPFTDLNDQTQSQLKILGELAVVFSSIHACFWLRGGWAIDFLLGRSPDFMKT
jgi:hypothetical protein